MAHDRVRWWCYRLSKTLSGSNGPSNMHRPLSRQRPTRYARLLFRRRLAPFRSSTSKRPRRGARNLYRSSRSPSFDRRGLFAVASKWEGDGTDSHEARRWAIDLAEDYAAHTISNSSAGPTFFLRIIITDCLFLSLQPPSRPSHPPHHGPPA